MGDSSIPSSKGVSSSSPLPGVGSINFRISDWEMDREFSLLSSPELFTGSLDDFDTVPIVSLGCASCDGSNSKSTLSRIGFCLSLERQNSLDLLVAVGVERDGDSHGDAHGEFIESNFSDSAFSRELSKKDSVDLIKLFLRKRILFFQRIFFSLPLINRVKSAGGCCDGWQVVITLFCFLDIIFVVADLAVDGTGGGGDDDDDAEAGINAESIRCCSSSNDLNGFLLKLADNR